MPPQRVPKAVNQILPAGTLATVLLATLLTGCIFLDTSDDPAIELPPMTTGDAYTYEGTREGTLQVNVTGIEPRTDHRLVTHDALLLTITYRENPHQAPFEFEQAISLETRLIVHETAVCGRPLDDRSDCYDERSAILFGNTNQPGALATAPLWDTTLQPDQPAPLTKSENAPTYTLQPTDDQHQPCLQATPNDPPPTPTTTPYEPSGPLTICDDLPAPLTFRAHDGQTYTLTHHDQATTASPESSEPATHANQTAVPLRSWSNPFFVHDETDPARLTVQTAHQQALDQNERYRTFFDEHPEATLVHTNFIKGAEGTAGAGTFETTTWERELSAHAPTGDTITILVEEHILQDRTISYDVHDPTEDRTDTPLTPDNLPENAAQIGPTIQLGKTLTQLPLIEWWGTWESLQGPDFHAYVQPTQDPFHVVMFEEPNQEDNQFFVRPSYLILDAATGNLVLFERPSQYLPFDGRLLDP